MRESHAFRGHAFEPGSGVACAAVRRKAFISEVIGHDEDDIRQSGGWRAGPGSGQENLQGEPTKPAPCPRRSLDEPPAEAEGSAAGGAALVMRANGPGRFCQVFLRVIHNFSPSVPFRAGNRAPPHTSRKKWSIRTDHRPHRKTSFGPVGPVDPARLSRLVCLCLCLVGWVCQGAAGGVFRRFTSSFQVGVEVTLYYPAHGEHFMPGT